MWGIKVKYVLGPCVIAAGSGLALALIAGTAASSATAGGAARQAAAAAQPGNGFSVSLERRGTSHGEVAPGATVPYQIGIRLPAGSTDDITIATVSDPVGVTLSAICQNRPVKDPPSAGSLPNGLASELHSAALGGRHWRPTCALTASGSTRIRAVVHVPTSIAGGTTIQIAVLGFFLPAADTQSWSGRPRPALAIAFASLTTRPNDREPDNDESPSPSPTPTVSATPSATQGAAALTQEYLASMVAALAHTPNAALAAALRSLASAFQQLAAAIPVPTATPTPLPYGNRSLRSPSPTATSTLLPLIPSSSTGHAQPTQSPSSARASNAALASGDARPASSSTANLNWPDVAAIVVVIGAILAFLVWRRSRDPQVRHDNRG
jgi:hypothetical protein